MTTASIAFCVAIIAIETVFVPLYLKRMWPTKNKVSLCYKMLCATGYIAIAIAAALQNGFGQYAKLMLIAFAASWLGDLFLHIPKPSKSYFFIGMAFFMASHISFCASYIKVICKLSAEKPIFAWQEIAAIIFIEAAFYIITYIKGVRFGKIAPAVIIYGIFVTTMMVKSVNLGLLLLASGSEPNKAAAILLLVGGINFVLSDGSLALIMFDTRFKKFRLKVFNIVTYFIAQLCLAMTVFFI